MEKVIDDPMSPLEKESRKQIYEQLQGVSEANIDSFWESLKEHSTHLSQDEVILNSLVTKVRKEFENDRRQQIQRFRLVTFLKIREWIHRYNRADFKEMNLEGEKIGRYLYNSTEPLTLPIPKESEERFPGLVAVEAIKLHARFQLLRSWIKAYGSETRKINELKSYDDLMNVTEATFWKQTLDTSIRRDSKSAAD